MRAVSEVALVYGSTDGNWKKAVGRGYAFLLFFRFRISKPQETNKESLNYTSPSKTFFWVGAVRFLGYARLAFCNLLSRAWQLISLSDVGVSLAERSKAPDSSSGGAIRVGSNPTAVILSFDLSLVGSELEKKRSWADLNPHRWIQSPEC